MKFPDLEPEIFFGYERKALNDRICLAPVIRRDGPGPKGQESLAQGLPWVSR